jgi:hypothetical protein
MLKISHFSYDSLSAHRVRAALLAISRRRAGSNLSALARPPFFPPSLPSATAAGFFRFFPAVMEIGSEVDSSTTRNAASLKSSCFLRFFIFQ